MYLLIVVYIDFLILLPYSIRPVLAYLRSPCDDDADIQAKSSGALHSLRFPVSFFFFTHLFFLSSFFLVGLTRALKFAADDQRTL